jgi:hypothetical protein
MAGNIDPSLNLNLNQQASFEVRDPSQAAANLLQSQVALTNNERTNFQTGINNAITQAAANMRNQQNNQAEMIRQMEKQAFDRQQAVAAEDRLFKRNYQTETDLNKFMENVVTTGIKAGYNKEQIRDTLRAGVAEFTNFTPNELLRKRAQEVLSSLEVEDIQADPLKQETSFNVDPTAGAIQGGVSAIQREPDLVDSISGQVNQALRLENLKIKEAENKLGIVSPEILEAKQALTDGTFAALEAEGVNITDKELQLYKNIEADRVKSSTGEASTKFAERSDQYSNVVSRKLKELRVDIKTMHSSLKEADKLGVRINPNAAKEVRAFLSRVGGTESTGITEWADALRAANIFDFRGARNPDGTPLSLEQQQEIKNSFITGLNQLESAGAYLAKQGGETGTLTNQDILRAMKSYISTSGDYKEFLDNMERGLVKLDANMAIEGYLYEDMADFHHWRKALFEEGYKLNESGIAEKINEDVDRPRSSSTTFSATKILPQEEEDELAMLEAKESGEEFTPSGRLKFGVPNSTIENAIKLSNKENGVNISTSLIKGLIMQESNGNPNARSTAGAIGLTQLLPSTAKDLGVNPEDPTDNVKGGVRYLGQLLRRYNGDTIKALTAYNWGMGNLDKAVRIHGDNYLQGANKEAREYAQRVLRHAGGF